MIFQKKEWLAWPPPLLRTTVRISSGSFKITDQVLNRFFLQIGFAFDGVIEVSDVSLMMFGVMDFHRLRIDVRLQSIVRIR